MNRRSIFIIVGALAVAALILFAWFWLFSRGGSAVGGLFGSAGNKTATTTATTGTETNIKNTVGAGATTGSGNLATGGSPSGGTNIPLGGGTTGAVGSTGAVGTTNTTGVAGTGVGGTEGPGTVTPGEVVPGTGVGGTGVDTGGSVDAVPGVDWLGGTGAGGTSGAATTNFVPTGINDLASGATGGTPVIQGAGAATPNGGTDLGAAAGILGATAAGCFAIFGIQSLVGTVGGTIKDSVPIAASVLVYDIGLNAKVSQNQYKTVQDCIARTIAKAALQQMTNSIVNWINSGFNGKPSFVQNFDQYFGNVADVAAGEFIKGSALSFLCSPFQLQVKIAIAQSYANRNGGGGSCSLSQVTNNINSFINGNFSAGGWPALLQFTTVPTNNPYGAYAYAQIGLANAQTAAVANANRNVTPGGFISIQKCDPPGSTKNCKTTTPGTAIESTLANQLKIPSDILTQAGVSGSFDAIISALLTQLTTRALYGGLTNLTTAQSGYANNFLTPAEQQAQSDAQSLLINLQGQVVWAQQYGSIEQGSISDIQNTQQQLTTLFNCWQAAGKMAEASTTQDDIGALETKVAVHNNNITRANAGIGSLQALESEVLSVSTPADVARAQTDYQSAVASGALITQDDITTASQNRTTLQSELAIQNSTTATSLAECKALPPTTTTQ